MVLNVTSHKLHPFYGNYKFLSPYLDRCTKHLGIELRSFCRLAQFLFGRTCQRHLAWQSRSCFKTSACSSHLDEDTHGARALYIFSGWLLVW